MPKPLLLRLLLLTTLPLTVWLLWPRPTTLIPLHPPTAAHHLITARQATTHHHTTTALLHLYQLHALQHRLPPIPAALATWHLHRAHHIHLHAADQPAREQALPHLIKLHTILRQHTQSTFDPTITAPIHLTTWTLALDPDKTNQLHTATAELLALLHGGRPTTHTTSARHLAASLRHSATHQWPQAATQQTAALTALKKTTTP